MRIRTSKVDWGAGIRFFIQEGRKYVTKMNFKSVEECAYMEETGHLSNEDAQLLIDDLWDCGLRPSEGMGSAGAMAAIQNHLKDLQKLVFKEKVIK